MPTFIAMKNGKQMGIMKGANVQGLRAFVHQQVTGETPPPPPDYVLDFYSP
jgi:hypothetical protein